MSEDIQKLVKRLKKFREERDWGKFHTAKNLAISIGIEASELMEYVQWRDGDELQKELETHKEDVEDEVADVFNYLLGFCEVMNIDILHVANRKLDKISKNIQ